MIEQRKRFPTATNRLKQICAFAVLLSVAALPCAYSQTGAEVMNKMMSAYKGLNSYQGNANGDQIYTLTTSEKPIAQVGTTVAMSYKKPNLLKLDFFTSKGSRSIFCDGTTITTYDPSGLQYIKFPSGSTMKEVAVNLQKVGVKALFDPLFFLSGDPLPKNLGKFTLKPNVKLNGVPIYLVVADLSTPPHEVKSPQGKKVMLPTTTAHFSWWIDKSNYLLSKMEMKIPNIPQNVSEKVKKKVVTRLTYTNMIIRTAISNVKANPPKDAKEFVFIPPKDAKERKTADQMLGGK